MVAGIQRGAARHGFAHYLAPLRPDAPEYSPFDDDDGGGDDDDGGGDDDGNVNDDDVSSVSPPEAPAEETSPAQKRPRTALEASTE
jgi:hypothetical protein